MCTPAELEDTFRQSEDLRIEITRDIGRYTIALFAGFDSAGSTQLKLAGTGTLLTVHGSYYILTASHVWEEVLKCADKVGLTLTEDIDHSFFMSVKAIVPSGLPRPACWNEWGPDLTLLRVPTEHLGSIKAYKSFYSATVDGKTTSGVDQLEARLLIGTPEELGEFTQNHAQVVIGGFFADVEAPCVTHGDFDYIDLKVDVSSPGTPQNYGGVSGGGLWKLLIRCECSTGRIEWDQVLEGVAFYQSDIENGHRTIRCHGPKSIEAAMPPSPEAEKNCE
jgi:hypothetical protein